MGTGPFAANSASRACTRCPVGSGWQAGFGDCQRGRHQQSESSPLEKTFLGNGFSRIGEGCPPPWAYADYDSPISRHEGDLYVEYLGDESYLTFYDRATLRDCPRPRR